MNSLLNSVQRRFKSRPDELLQHLPAAALVCIISKTAYDASQVGLQLYLDFLPPSYLPFFYNIFHTLAAILRYKVCCQGISMRQYQCTSTMRTSNLMIQ